MHLAYNDMRDCMYTWQILKPLYSKYIKHPLTFLYISNTLFNAQKKKKKTNTLFHIKNLGREHPVTPNICCHL